MHDTPSNISEKMRTLIQLKSPVERLKMGCSMYETSRYLILRAIMKDNPNISKSSLRKELFLKFYGGDFDSIKREKIAKYFESVS